LLLILARLLLGYAKLPEITALKHGLIVFVAAKLHLFLVLEDGVQDLQGGLLLRLAGRTCTTRRLSDCLLLDLCC
jgi:hypothetical protein